MGELRWILLGLGVIALIAIYLYSRFRIGPGAAPADTQRERLEPSLDGAPAHPDDSAEDAGDPPGSMEVAAPVPEPVPEKVVTIRLMARDRQGFPGDELVLAMRGAGLRHGRFGIFHAYGEDSEQVLFSVANLVEPGTFDLATLKDTRLPGVSLFLVLPVAGDCIEAFEKMIDTARSLAASLDGELLDEQGSSLSVQRERYIRDEIQQFVREHLTAQATGNQP